MGDRLTRLESVPRGHRLVSAPLDRVCAATGCSTLLSRYNSSDVCARHADADGAGGRRARRKRSSRAAG